MRSPTSKNLPSATAVVRSPKAREVRLEDVELHLQVELIEGVGWRLHVAVEELHVQVVAHGPPGDASAEAQDAGGVGARRHRREELVLEAEDGGNLEGGDPVAGLDDDVVLLGHGDPGGVAVAVVKEG